MKRMIIISLLLLSFNAFALDVTLRVNGQALRSIDADRVNIITSNTGILIEVRTEPKSSPQPPPPPPPPDLTDCNPRPSGVVVGVLDWRNPGGQKQISLGSNTLALRFTTTSNPAYSGQVNTTHTTTNATTRTQWISDCPGGAPLRPRCIASGREGVTLRWSQRPEARDCGLQTNTEYYFNVKNALPDNPNESTCSGACPFFMIVYTNQRP